MYNGYIHEQDLNQNISTDEKTSLKIISFQWPSEEGTPDIIDIDY